MNSSHVLEEAGQRDSLLLLRVTLGLLRSAFANTEFQTVQFMPLVVVPPILLC